MSLETDNREPSRYLNGEGCHVPLSNSCAAAQYLGGVSEGDRIGRAGRVSQENSSGASVTQPAVQGGNPTESAKAAGVVGVPRSSDDPADSKTDGEQRRGTWDNAHGHSEGPADGRTEAETLFDRITTPPKVQKLERALYRKAKAEPGYRSYAYRPKRNAQQAMAVISAALRSGRTEVIDADLSGYFDSIPHGELLRLVARRVSDGGILALIKAWLRAPIVERDPDTGRPTITGNRRGTPQGGVISPLLANLYLNRLDWQVNERCEERPVLVRYADDFVILSRPGQGAELQARLKRWLTAHGLTLNETKTRLLDVREEGFKFLGFGVSWRRGRSGRKYPHIEPHPKSQSKLRDKLREKLNHWTLWRAAEEVIPEVNRLLKGWGGCFHYANSTRFFDRLNQYAANRLQRWLWRKGGCRTALWATNPREVLRERHGLYRLPTRAAWMQARA